MGASSNKIKKNRLFGLIHSLKEDDCNIERLDSGIRISFDNGQIFEIFEIGGWIQVGSNILSEEELDCYDYIDEIKDFVLNLNSRCLGCRFALEPDGTLLLVEDIPVEQLTIEKIYQAIDAISYVDYMFFDFIIQTGKIGLAPSEDEVDAKVVEKEVTFQKYH